MNYRKALKKRAKNSLKKHYGLWVILCAISMFLGGEQIFTNEIWGDSTYIREMEGAEGLITGMSEYHDQFSEILFHIGDGNEDGGRQLANEKMQREIEESEGNRIFGRSRGCLSQVVNRVTSGSFLVSLGVAIKSIIRSDNITVMVLIALGMILVFGIWFLIINTYEVIMSRMFLEGHLYPTVRTNRTLFLLKTKKWLKASWVMLVKMIYMSLWSLTIIGGIIKHYSYFLVSYIVAENPCIGVKDAITLSRNLMKGHKWECFKFEISFIGWEIVNMLTMGISKLLFVRPYQVAASCEYYIYVRALGKENGVHNVDFLNDKYLYVEPNQEMMELAYQDIIAAQQKTKKEEKELTGIYRFLTEIFGLTIRDSKAERAFEERQAREMALFYYQEALDGKVYPVRLSAIPEAEKRKWVVGLNPLRCYSIWTIIVIFFSLSFGGWLWEGLLHLIADGKLINRGVLQGPWLPIYGAGCVLILLCLYRFRKNPANEFFAILVLCGAIEYMTSYGLEVIYHGKRWWDYSGYFLNLNGRICAEGLLVFGLGGMAVTYFLAPLVDNAVRRISRPVVVGLCVILIVLFGIDGVYSAKNPNVGVGITSYESRIEYQYERNSKTPRNLARGSVVI